MHDMKQTLREKVEKMLSDLIDRQEQLKEYINAYKQDGQFQEAAKCQTQLNTLDTVRRRLIDVLKP